MKSKYYMTPTGIIFRVCGYINDPDIILLNPRDHDTTLNLISFHRNVLTEPRDIEAYKKMLFSFIKEECKYLPKLRLRLLV